MADSDEVTFYGNTKLPDLGPRVCGRCKWAVEDGGRRDGWAHLTLRCTRPNNPDYLYGGETLAHWYEDLIVAPNFGCVQWEATP